MQTLFWTALQGVLAFGTFCIALVAAVFGFVQYKQTLRRDRIKATSDAIDDAARTDATYLTLLRTPSLKAEDDGKRHLERMRELYAKPVKSDAEQSELNAFWDASTPVNDYFASSMKLIEAKYLDEKLFFARLDTFTSVAFLIVYPGLEYLSGRKNLGADLGSFRSAAKRAKASLIAKEIDNEFTRINLDVAPYV